MPRQCSIGPGTGFLTGGTILPAKGIDDALDHWEGVKSVDELIQQEGLKPIPDADGNILLTHYSGQERLTELDPTYMGRMDETGQTIGLRNSNFRQGAPAIPYTSFGLNVGHPKGYKKEQGLGDIEYIAKIPVNRIYDIEADPDFLRAERDRMAQEQNIPPMDRKSRDDMLSQLIKDAGYAGFFVSNGAGYGLTAAIWETTSVQQLGPRNKEAVAEASASKFENMLEGWRITPEEIALSRAEAPTNEYIQPAVLKKMAFNKIAKDPKVNLDTDFEWASTVIKSNTIKPLGAVQQVPTFREMIRSLKSKATTGLIRQGGGDGYKRINMGTRVKSRLDIPSYLDTDTWIVTIHALKAPSAVIGYAKSAVLNDVEFGEFSNAAKKVAAGINAKSTFATMSGDWVDVSAIQAEQMANEALAGGWVEVGMNPNRYGYFYIKETGQKILSSSQVIQVGPLVLAKLEGASIEETPHSQLLTDSLQ